MKDPKVPVPDSELRKVALLTAEMRHYEQVIADLAEQRRVECLRLNKPEDGRQKVTYERLAQARPELRVVDDQRGAPTSARALACGRSRRSRSAVPAAWSRASRRIVSAAR